MSTSPDRLPTLPPVRPDCWHGGGHGAGLWRVPLLLQVGGGHGEDDRDAGGGAGGSVMSSPPPAGPGNNLLSGCRMRLASLLG